jgi:hypothetical protein
MRVFKGFRAGLICSVVISTALVSGRAFGQSQTELPQAPTPNLPEVEGPERAPDQIADRIPEKIQQGIQVSQGVQVSQMEAPAESAVTPLLNRYETTSAADAFPAPVFGPPGFAPLVELPESIAETTDFPQLGAPMMEGGRVPLNGLFAAMSRPESDVKYDPNNPPSERFHLRGMLWQSLAFQGVENVYRLITDANMRRLTADKPYWADYFASLNQWNMRRWWDGDDFLVDYIGHPMEGGVASFIEIQNSPRQRLARFGTSHEYWRSRFLGLMWATVYSTQQKIGPLGEAALGSDGGITYPLNCPYPCKTYKPGVTKYTNNTGWTDFIATPVIGSIWVLLEDILDKEVSDRLQHGDMNAVFPKIVRGAINPTRTMANAMRWRKPWYRDFQHEVPQPRMQMVHFLPGDEAEIAQAPRYEVFAHYTVLSLPVNTGQCTRCRKSVTGPGVGFAARLSKWVDFDSDVNWASNASPLPSDRAGGNLVSGTFGLRSGFENSRFALKVAVRPGFVSYDKAYESSPSATNLTPTVGRITHFAAALALNGDIIVARHIALRAVVDNTPVRYREPYLAAPIPGKPPYLSWLSREAFLTNENWGYQTGAVVRF